MLRFFIPQAPQATFEDMIPPAQKASMMGPQPTNMTIKTVSSQDKLKEQKKSSQQITQDELKASTDQMLTGFLDGYDTEEALATLRAIKPPKR